MREETFKIDISDPLMDVDLDESGNYIAITDKYEVITATESIQLSLHLFYPIIRWLSANLFLVVGARTEEEVVVDNAFIYSRAGDLVQSFYTGDGVGGVLIFNDKIVITYLDEGVFGSSGPNLEGLAVFNLNGELLYGFNSVSKWLISDCYGACKADQNTALFYPDDELPLVSLNLDDYSWEQCKTPKAIRGARAMASINGQLILYQTNTDKETFFLWTPGQKSVKKCGVFTGPIVRWLRGLTKGRFVNVIEDGYVIISPLED